MPHDTVAIAVGASTEGTEVRFGVPGSALFGQAATATADGAANSSYDSFASLGGGVLMANMMLGEVSPGGAGSGLYGLVIIALLAVFLGGLMIGRTPEYLGKRLGPREMKLVEPRPSSRPRAWCSPESPSPSPFRQGLSRRLTPVRTGYRSCSTLSPVAWPETVAPSRVSAGIRPDSTLPSPR